MRRWVRKSILCFILGLIAVGGAISSASAFDLNYLMRQLQMQTQQGQMRPGMQQPNPQEHVARLQRMLNDLGYDAGIPNGVLSPRTRKALARFQSDRGIPADGMLGPQTVAVLEGAWRQRGAAQPSRGGIGVPAYPEGPSGEVAASAGAPAGPSFSCARAANATERAICASPALSALDRAVEQAFASANTRAGSGAANLRQEQTAWLKSRNACGANPSCIRERYEERGRNLAAAALLTGGAPGASTEVQSLPLVVGGGVDPLQFAARASIVRIGDRLALMDRPTHVDLHAVPGDKYDAQHSRNVDTAYNRSIDGWRRFLETMVLARYPGVIDQSDFVPGYLINAYLSPEQQARVLAGPRNENGDVMGKLNTFQRQEALDRFRREFAGPLVSNAPRLPLRVVDIRRLGTQPYDFAREAFPISHSGISSLNLMFPASHTFVGLGSNTSEPQTAIVAPLGLTSMPNAFPVPRSQAQSVLNGLKASAEWNPDHRVIYMAFFATVRDISGIQPGPHADGAKGLKGQAALDVVLEKVSLYADPGLTREIAVLDVSALRSVPVAPPDAELVELSRVMQTPSESLIPTMARLARDPGFIERVVRAGHLYGRANEFERERVLGSEVARITGREQAAIWLGGAGVLGEYDLASQTFPLGRVALRPSSPSGDFYGSNVDIKIANEDAIAKVPSSRSRAEPAVNALARGDRSVIVTAKVRPAAAEMVAGQQARGRLFVEIEDLFVTIDRGNGQRPLLVARFRPQSLTVSAPALGARGDAPAKVALDYETLDLLIIRQNPQLFDGMADRLFYDRWLREVLPGDPPAGRFFKIGQEVPTTFDRERMRPAFRQWMLERAGALPATATLTASRSPEIKACLGRLFPHDGGVQSPGDPLRELRMTIFSAPRPHVIDGVQFTHEGRPVFYGSPGCATAARDEVRRVVGVDAMKPPAAQVVLDRVQLPDGKTYGGLSHSEYDIEIADVALGPERPTPSLSIRATAGEARHFSSRTGPAVARLAPNVAKGLDSGGGRDVSGIRLGMSFDDADRIIRGHMTVGRVLETGPAGLQSEGQTALFHAARLYMRDDNMEMFLLLHAPPTVDRQVIGIVRTLTQPSGELSIEDFRQAVIDKYGEPSKLAGPLPERLEYLSERAMLRWTQCRLNPSQTREDPVWIENGQVSDWRSPDIAEGPAHKPADPGFLHFLDWPRLVARDASSAAECGQAVDARFSQRGSSRGPGTSTMVIMLADFTTAANALGSARAAVGRLPAGASGTTRPVDPALTKKLKL